MSFFNLASSKRARHPVFLPRLPILFQSYELQNNPSVPTNPSHLVSGEGHRRKQGGAAMYVAMGIIPLECH